MVVRPNAETLKGGGSVKILSLEQLLQDQLRSIYDAEKQLLTAMPEMAKAAYSQELKEAIQAHIRVTENQLVRLDEVFASIGTEAPSESCTGMKGLIQEGQETITKETTDALRDAVLIGAASRIEHYEISAYGTARGVAERLRLDHVAELLQETITEEEEADEKLTEISESLLELLATIEESDQGKRHQEGPRY
jgi:ferritin-like metal-binding protein YciE